MVVFNLSSWTYLLWPLSLCEKPFWALRPLASFHRSPSHTGPSPPDPWVRMWTLAVWIPRSSASLFCMFLLVRKPGACRLATQGALRTGGGLPPWEPGWLGGCLCSGDLKPHSVALSPRSGTTRGLSSGSMTDTACAATS